ncbi:MAG: hypothetical protein US89_C0013G0031 [Candidatus Peregrinibacteria bacterium GW2011_GWF2_38_29]|nr:MAG: hypothetical protein US89_C0013G0031 [Candidatus Peregrinibacteria bacterium GW2011_GWF2_38_29]HBB02411.1 hypothetical protein [Candidatus Peregrinibacteria bacterium]
MNFFQQFQKLREATPQIGFHGYQNINSDYSDFLYFSKNSYLCFMGDYQENCFYSECVYKNRHCVDCSYVQYSELLYECMDSVNCYNSSYLQDCKQTSESMFCFDCISCNNCFGCAGLRHKQYHVFNKPFSKEEYEKKVAILKKESVDKLYAEFEKVKLTVPHLFSRQFQTDNAIGDHLWNCRNAYLCYDSEGLQDCSYMHRVYNIYGERTADSLDSALSVDMQLCYQTYFVGKGYNCNFCFYCEFVRDCEYCDSCFHSEKLFLCVGLNKRKYCILNEQYTEEEWPKKVAEIKEQLRGEGLYGDWPKEWCMNANNAGFLAD